MSDNSAAMSSPSSPRPPSGGNFDHMLADAIKTIGTTLRDKLTKSLEQKAVEVRQQMRSELTASLSESLDGVRGDLAKKLRSHVGLPEERTEVEGSSHSAGSSSLKRRAEEESSTVAAGEEAGEGSPGRNGSKRLRFGSTDSSGASSSQHQGGGVMASAESGNRAATTGSDNQQESGTTINAVTAGFALPCPGELYIFFRNSGVGSHDEPAQPYLATILPYRVDVEFPLVETPQWEKPPVAGPRATRLPRIGAVHLGMPILRGLSWELPLSDVEGGATTERCFPAMVLQNGEVAWLPLNSLTAYDDKSPLLQHMANIDAAYDNYARIRDFRRISVPAAENSTEARNNVEQDASMNSGPEIEVEDVGTEAKRETDNSPTRTETPATSVSAGTFETRDRQETKVQAATISHSDETGSSATAPSYFDNIDIDALNLAALKQATESTEERHYLQDYFAGTDAFFGEGQQDVSGEAVEGFAALPADGRTPAAGYTTASVADLMWPNNYLAAVDYSDSVGSRDAQIPGRTNSVHRSCVKPPPTSSNSDAQSPERTNAVRQPSAKAPPTSANSDEIRPQRTPSSNNKQGGSYTTVFKRSNLMSTMEAARILTDEISKNSSASSTSSTNTPVTNSVGSLSRRSSSPGLFIDQAQSPPPAPPSVRAEFFIQAYWRGNYRKWSGTDSGRFMHLVEKAGDGTIETEAIYKQDGSNAGTAINKANKVQINPREIMAIKFDSFDGGDGDEDSDSGRQQQSNKLFVTIHFGGKGKGKHHLLFRDRYMGKQIRKTPAVTQAGRFYSWVKKANPAVTLPGEAKQQKARKGNKAQKP